MEAIKIEDFVSFKYLSNIMTHESGTYFVQTTCNKEDNAYEANIYRYGDSGVQKITSGNKESSFQFLDDQHLVFTSIREKQDQAKIEAQEELSVFYKMPLHGGEARVLCRVPLQVASFTCIDADTLLLDVNYSLRFSHMYTLKDKEEILQAKNDIAHYETFESVPFYFNGVGFLRDRIRKLFVYKISSNQLQAISEDDVSVSGYEYKEGKVLYTCQKVVKRKQYKHALCEYTFANEKTEVLIAQKEYSISVATYLEDKILFLGNKELVHGMNENAKFFVYDCTKKEIKCIHDYTYNCYNSVGSDVRFGGGRAFKVYEGRFYFVSTRECHAHLYSIDLAGEIHLEVEVNGSVDCFDVCDKGIHFIALMDNQLQEVYAYKDEMKQLTKQNTALDQKYVADYQEVVFENDGISFTGWVLLPQDYDPNKSYPTLLDIHGGPKTVYGKVYYHEMQVLANMGFIVCFTNPRGSDGRDNAFMDIFGKYGSIDYDDLMKFMDCVIARFSVDTERLGVFGGSYGGFMTNWIVSHTTRFKAAVSQRCISNWISFYGTSDIGTMFTEDQLHANIFTSMEKLWDHSPLKYVSNVKTPTLIIHSDEDYRCPLEQGLQFYTALVDLGVETRFLMLKGENHDLSRSGKIIPRIKRLEEICDWMQKYLQV